MWIPGYRRRLIRDSARWLAAGWISSQARAEILRDAGTEGALGRTLSLLGALLAGVGVITFVAANWDSMAALHRLAVLLAALGVGLAGCRLAERRGGAWLESMALLTLLLFGANINLIAQTFHISAHWPDGVLLWALGGLAITVLLEAETAVLGTLVLGLIWSWGEIIDYDRVLWGYLLFLLATAIPILVWHWERPWRLWVLSLGWWLVATVIIHYELQVRVLQLLGMVAILLLALGAWLRGGALWAWTGHALLQAGSLSLLGIALLFSYPEPWSLAHRADLEPLWYGWLVVAALPVLAAIGLALRRVEPADLLAWLPFTLILLAAELDQGGWAPVLINLLYFGGLVLLIWRASAVHDAGLLRLAVGFFLIGLGLRYLEQFWSLLDRSIAFVAGGVLLLLLGWWAGRRRGGAEP